MNMQDFAKQWEEAVEALETSETAQAAELRVRSALVAGGSWFAKLNGQDECTFSITDGLC